MADDPARSCQSVALRRCVEIAPRGAAAAFDPARGRIDADLVHCAEMDHEAAVADRGPGIIVTPSPDRDLKTGFAGEPHRRSDLLRVGAARDHCRPAVDGAVPNRARAVVFGVAGPQGLAGEFRNEGFNLLAHGVIHFDPPTKSQSGRAYPDAAAIATEATRR